ncbi:MAG: hypothetical protein GXP61_08045 [Epsilonproteobacteria bacterium]|nr:hypothetical protein [Campylobacterota bacterium]
MQSFEVILSKVASRCEYEYGFNGVVGYMYASVKDNLRWNNLSIKHYIHILMGIGRFMALDEKDFAKESVKQNKMDPKNIASALISAFGDGK